jgi:hypothetical protein
MTTQDNSNIQKLMALISTNPDQGSTIENVVFSSTNYDIVERPLSKSHPHARLRKTLADVKDENSNGYGFDFNREVNEASVKKHLASFEKDLRRGGSGFAPNFPLTFAAPREAGEKFKIIDGQHRFEALCRLNDARAIAGDDPIPFYYTIRFQEVTVEDLSGINSIAANWRLASHVKSYATKGKDAYKRLIELHDEFEIPYTAFDHAKNRSMEMQHLFRGDLKAGTFEFVQYSKLKNFLDDAKEIVDAANDAYRAGRATYPKRDVVKWKMKLTYRIAWSLYHLSRLKGFDKTRLRMNLSALAERGDAKILGITNTTGALDQAFIAIYNYSTAGTNRKIQNHKGDLVFKNETDNMRQLKTGLDQLMILEKDIPA